ncbi:MAG: hypothetical protein ACOCZ5_01255 [bacterium]
MNNAIIVKSGLNKINEANENGVKISLVYYLPMFDSRIEENTNIEDVVDISANIPMVGDTDDDRIYWKNNTEPDEIEYPKNKDLFLGIGFSNKLSEDGKMKSVYTIDTSLQLSETITEPIKINKIAIYGILEGQYDILDGDTIPSHPFLFGYCIYNIPMIQNPLDSGEVNSELLLDFTFSNYTYDMDYNELLYTDDENYWKKVNDNRVIYHNGSVYISKTTSINDRRKYVYENIDSVSRLFSTIFDDEYNNMVLQYVDEDYNKHRTSFKLDSNNDNVYLGIDSTLYPRYTNEYGIGKSDSRWNHCYVSNLFRLYNDFDVFNDEKKHIKFDLENENVNFHYIDVYCNKNFYGNIKTSQISSNFNYDNNIKSNNFIFDGNGNIHCKLSIIPKNEDNNQLSLGDENCVWEDLFINNIIGTNNEIIIHNDFEPIDESITIGTWNNKFNLYVNEIDSTIFKFNRIENVTTINTNKIVFDLDFGNYVIAKINDIIDVYKLESEHNNIVTLLSTEINENGTLVFGDTITVNINDNSYDILEYISKRIKEELLINDRDFSYRTSNITISNNLIIGRARIPTSEDWRRHIISNTLSSIRDLYLYGSQTINTTVENFSEKIDKIDNIFRSVSGSDNTKIGINNIGLVESSINESDLDIFKPITLHIKQSGLNVSRVVSDNTESNLRLYGAVFSEIFNINHDDGNKDIERRPFGDIITNENYINDVFGVNFTSFKDFLTNNFNETDINNIINSFNDIGPDIPPLSKWAVRQNTNPKYLSSSGNRTNAIMILDDKYSLGDNSLGFVLDIKILVNLEKLITQQFFIEDIKLIRSCFSVVKGTKGDYNDTNEHENLYQFLGLQVFILAHIFDKYNTYLTNQLKLDLWNFFINSEKTKTYKDYGEERMFKITEEGYKGRYQNGEYETRSGNLGSFYISKRGMKNRSRNKFTQGSELISQSGPASQGWRTFNWDLIYL